MTSLDAWITERRPKPPMSLLQWTEDAPVGRETTRGLGDAGLAALAKARSVRGRVRSSAFDLLAADALFTYACEAAIEEADPAAALAALLDAIVEST